MDTRKVLYKLFGIVAVKALVSLALIGSGVVRFRRPLEEGAEAPRNLLVTDQDGKPLDLGEILQEPGWSVIFFYPRAGSPGCTQQVCNLRDGFTELRDKGVRVFGVSGDSVAAQGAFKEKQRLPFTLIADPRGEVARAFGISRVGPLFPRHTFLVRDGKIVYRQLWAKPETQAEEILERV
jgi:peroxiredoxin Q/BCP